MGELNEKMILTFENEAAADEFGLKLELMEEELIIQFEDAAEVVRDADGTAHVKHGNRMDTASSRGGLFGKIGRKSSDEAVLRQMGDAVPPGKAGWYMLIGRMVEEKFFESIAGTEAEVARTNLSSEDEAELRAAFAAEEDEK